MSQTIETAQQAQVIQVAVKFVKDLLSNEPVEDFRLEEFQESPDHGAWLVTVGFLREEHRQPLKYLAGVSMKVRTYKVIEVDKQSGMPIAMRNREDE